MPLSTSRGSRHGRPPRSVVPCRSGSGTLPRTASHCSSVRSIDQGTNTFSARWKEAPRTWSNLDHLPTDWVVGCVLEEHVRCSGSSCGLSGAEGRPALLQRLEVPVKLFVTLRSGEAQAEPSRAGGDARPPVAYVPPKTDAEGVSPHAGVGE